MQEVLKPIRSRGFLSCEARHPGAKGSGHHRVASKHSQNAKKRDISTSFRKGPVPRPLVNTTQQPAQEEPLVGIPPPAPASSKAGNKLPEAFPALLSTADASTGLFLGEPCRISSRASLEPVVAAAAAAVALPVLTSRDLGLTLDSSFDSSFDSLSLDDSSVTSSLSSDSDEGAWCDDPLASFDRVLDGLLVMPTPLPMPTLAPKTPSSSSSSTTTSSSNLTLSSLLSDAPTSTAAAVLPASSTGLTAGKKRNASSASSSSPKSSTSSSSSRGSKSSSSSRSGRSYAQSLSAAAAAPAVTVIHCETEYERELAAAAALQQLLVVKVESTQHLLQGVHDSSLRFQTHTNLPTQLNAYLPHSDLNQGFGFMSNTANSSGSGGSSSSSTNEVLASMGINLGASGVNERSSSSSMGPSNSLFGSHSSSGGEPFSPVHAWYKQLAAQYAHGAAAAGRTSPVRFLSLQCDGARARAVARRLGTSAPLAAVLVDASSGRKLQEVCGAKIEQELPNGLLYFGGSDPTGLNTSELVTQVNTQDELEALKSSSQLCVMAFHIHAAPPCVRSYARMHAVAQSYAHTPAAGPNSTSSTAATPAAPIMSFGVLDVDVSAEGGVVSTQLGLQQLPTYVIYQGGQEVARLSSSPDRRKLGEVLAQHAAAAAAAAVAAATAATKQQQ